MSAELLGGGVLLLMNVMALLDTVKRRKKKLQLKFLNHSVKLELMTQEPLYVLIVIVVVGVALILVWFSVPLWMKTASILCLHLKADCCTESTRPFPGFP